MKSKHLNSSASRSLTGLILLAALLLAALPAPRLPADESVAPGKTQRLDSREQTPEGLSTSDWASIRAAYEAGRHAFMPIAGGWQTRNPGQQWTTKFDERGFLATPREGDWTWGLELRSYGFGEQQTPVGARAPQMKAEGQRLTYQWDGTVQEWWVNDQRGLEHGYVIQQRPPLPEPRSSGRESAPSELGEKSEPTHVGWAQRANPLGSSFPALSPGGGEGGRRPGEGESSLCFVLAVRGNLKPKVSDDALGVLFEDASGATVLNYTGLKVWDADGKILPTRFEAVELERGVHAASASARDTALKRPEGRAPQTDTPSLRLLVDDRGARYPITIDPIAQQAYLKAHQVSAGDHFGSSVAVSGDTVVVGAIWEDSSTTGVDSTPNQLATPPSDDFALQESLSLSAVGWSNSPSDETNPITLPAARSAKFFQLFK
jgi:hypothetical protein